MIRVLASLLLAHLLAAPCLAEPLRAGFAKEDITPSEPVQLGGYDLRTGLSEGVYEGDKLFVRALAFDDGTRRVLFVESDVIGAHAAEAFPQRIAAATGVPRDHILFGDAHNHATPMPNPDGRTKFDKRYAEAIIAAAKGAIAALQPVRIAAGEGRSRVAMNRRQVRPVNSCSPITFDENNVSQSFGAAKTNRPVPIKEFGGVVRLGANPAGPIDDAVQLVRIDDAAGRPLALMIHYACHGTSLGGRNARVSGEWMGRMQAVAERQVPGLGAMFVQGAAGDINPRVVGGLDGHADNIRATWALGEEIGAEVVRVYRTLQPQPLEARIEIATRQIELPRTYRELFADFRRTAIPVPTTLLRIGPLAWVTFPGELFSGIGKRVKAACPAPHAHLMGYTNGSVGYLPEQRTFAEGGYEPAVSHFDPTAELVYLRQLAEMLKGFP